MVFALHYTEKNRSWNATTPFIHLFLYPTQTKQYVSRGKERKKGMVSIYE
jgi:hypothetical protein